MSNKLLAVTGGASGIGEAVARKFAADGYSVAILDINRTRGCAVAADLRSQGRHATFHACDVSSSESVESTAGAIERELGCVDVLVASAALIPDAESVFSIDLESHDRFWQVNYWGVLHACRSFGRRMANRRSGAIVAIGSINQFHALPLPAYNPAKAALQRLTEILAIELGRSRVRVNTVAPTYVMSANVRARIESGQRDVEKILASHALELLPNADDVANAIAFLASDHARAITGVSLPVDSGWSICSAYLNYAGGVPWNSSIVEPE